MNPARRVLLFILAILLAALLAFLYLKTQGVDFARHVRINEHLRNLKTIDGKWNEALLRSRSDVGVVEASQLITSDQSVRELERLANETAALNVPLLTANVASLKTVYEQKLNLMKQFQDNAQALSKLRSDTTEQMLALQAKARGFDAGKNLVLKGNVESLVGLLAPAPALITDFGVRGGDALQKKIETQAKTLKDVASSLPVELNTSAIADNLSAIASMQPIHDDSFNRIYLYSTGPRTDSAAKLFTDHLQEQLDEREQYRVYLFFFSGALLVLLGYIAAQLIRSYRTISDVNAQLKNANETLEQKVHERTRDLSDALKQLKESETMLVQSEKMSSLGQMVAGVAHEINTPLAYVKSSLESVNTQVPEVSTLLREVEALLRMMQSSDASESQITNQFSRVTALTHGMREHDVMDVLSQQLGDGLYGINQISELVANLKNFSRLDRTKVAQFNLHEGLDSTLQIARNMVKHKHVEKHFGEIPLVPCSPSQINQVFLNLITNAAQATSESDGMIRITTRRVGESAVAVDIEDNGSGIAPEVLPKIFDPFFTTKEVGKGTGLGLSIAYKIVQQHGGKIEVVSKVGQGTKFTVTLPLEAAPQAVAA